jgi:hypothetical protein
MQCFSIIFIVILGCDKCIVVFLDDLEVVVSLIKKKKDLDAVVCNYYAFVLLLVNFCN